MFCCIAFLGRNMTFGYHAFACSDVAMLPRISSHIGASTQGQAQCACHIDLYSCLLKVAPPSSTLLATRCVHLMLRSSHAALFSIIPPPLSLLKSPSSISFPPPLSSSPPPSTTPLTPSSPPLHQHPFPQPHSLHPHLHNTPPPQSHTPPPTPQIQTSLHSHLVITAYPPRTQIRGRT